VAWVPETVAHPGTKRDRRRVTSLIEIDVLDALTFLRVQVVYQLCGFRLQ